MQMLTLIAAVLALASAFFLYGINYETRQLEARVNAQERVADEARSDIAILKAERAHLGRPDRIEPLARAQGLDPCRRRTDRTRPDRGRPHHQLNSPLRCMTPMRVPLTSHAHRAVRQRLTQRRGRGCLFRPRPQRSQRLRASAVVVGVGAAFAAVAGQLAMLAAKRRQRDRADVERAHRQELCAARHRGPRRPPAGDRRRDAVAVRRPVADQQRRRGGGAAYDGPARHR